MPLYQPLIIAILNQVPLATVRLLIEKGHSLDYQFSTTIARQYSHSSPYSFIIKFIPEAYEQVNREHNSYVQALMLELLRTPPTIFPKHKTEILHQALQSFARPLLLRRLIELGANLNEKVTTPLDRTYTFPLWNYLIIYTTLPALYEVYSEFIFEYAQAINITVKVGGDREKLTLWTMLFGNHVPISLSYSNPYTSSIRSTLEYKAVPAVFVERFLQVFAKQIGDINRTDADGNTLLALCTRPGKPSHTTSQEIANYQQCVAKLRLLAFRPDVKLDVTTYMKEDANGLDEDGAAIQKMFEILKTPITLVYDNNRRAYFYKSPIFARCCAQDNDDMVEILIDATKARSLAEFTKLMELSDKMKFFLGLDAQKHSSVLSVLNGASLLFQDWRTLDAKITAINQEIDKLRSVASRPTLDMNIRQKFELKIVEQQQALAATQQVIQALQHRPMREYLAQQSATASQGNTIATTSQSTQHATNSR